MNKLSPALLRTRTLIVGKVQSGVAMAMVRSRASVEQMFDHYERGRQCPSSDGTMCDQPTPTKYFRHPSHLAAVLSIG